MSKHTVSCSSGMSLHFPGDVLHKLYLAKEEQLNIETYKAIRDANGIWASNQDKFVASRAELNDMDCKHMEKLYDLYYGSILNEKY